MTLDRIVAEFEYAAEYMARHGLKGNIGDPLPNYMSADAVEYVNAHLEDFQNRVRQCAYAQAMNRTTAKHEKGLNP